MMTTNIFAGKEYGSKSMISKGSGCHGTRPRRIINIWSWYGQGKGATSLGLRIHSVILKEKEVFKDSRKNSVSVFPFVITPQCSRPDAYEPRKNMPKKQK